MLLVFVILFIIYHMCRIESLEYKFHQDIKEFSKIVNGNKSLTFRLKESESLKMLPNRPAIHAG